ncbi:hypothetical protein G7L40_21565 [Paenibacillus polymyxa]|nr:hypothetical protein [Paenibacillus polymyxa]UOD84270.1 hypothetical protein CUU60_03295 [Paenibacillus polymyxa ATCC 842]MBG9765320.1 hypothetical protein [Paenibacillus polymyxa]QPK55047.1 hypothetical protein G7035_21625 [Paenibacillus polymyxa]QPK60137.1 hypothetical protein G7L40_21565 [Paenibacillus polymyxa]
MKIMSMKLGRKTTLCFSTIALLFSVLSPLSASADVASVTHDTYTNSLNLELVSSQLVIFKDDTAYTDVSIVGKRVKFSISGLENPFNTNYYNRLVWTSTDEEPNIKNILTVKVAPKTGSLYSSSNYENLSLIKQKINSDSPVYGWIQLESKEWVKAGSAIIKY